MKVCICGGGNIGHVAAGFIASRPNFNVSLLTRYPERWSDKLTINLPDGGSFDAVLQQIGRDPKDVVSDADIVLLCLPGYSIRETLLRIKDAVRPGTAVGSVVSSTGFFFEAMEVLPESIPLFGLQRVPFIARTREYGHRASLLGYKSQLHVAIERTERQETLLQTIEQMFNTPTILMHNFYEVSLSNSNPLLHPARLYDLWHDWQEGDTFSRVPYFYEEWTEQAAEIYIAMDNELQTLLKALPVTPGSIATVLDYYEQTDAASLAAKLRSIEAFKGILAPMKQTEGGFYLPDFHSRYFTEDFPYGLAIVLRLMQKHGIEAPNIDCVSRWGMEMINKQK